jgi:large subunit ribosomal protein L30e
MANNNISSAEIKKLLKSEKVITGTERTLKSLRLGKVQKIMVSSNCPSETESDIRHYAAISGTEVYKLEYPNEELGIMCKKPFSISVLAFLKGAGK